MEEELREDGLRKEVEALVEGEVMPMFVAAWRDAE